MNKPPPENIILFYFFQSEQGLGGAFECKKQKSCRVCWEFGSNVKRRCGAEAALWSVDLLQDGRNDSLNARNEHSQVRLYGLLPTAIFICDQKARWKT